MNTHKDFEEFLRLLTGQGVDFVIVGGYAVAFHGYVRATQDMDLFFRNYGRQCPPDSPRSAGIRAGGQ